MCLKIEDPVTICRFPSGFLPTQKGAPSKNRRVSWCFHASTGPNQEAPLMDTAARMGRLPRSGSEPWRQARFVLRPRELEQGVDHSGSSQIVIQGNLFLE